MSNYAIYPSLLDAYVWMQAAEDGEQYGQRKRELMDKLCRVPQPPSAAAARGTALNELVDGFLRNAPIDPQQPFSARMDVSMGYAGAEKVWTCDIDGFRFAYGDSVVERLVQTVQGCIAQPYLEAEIATDHGSVRLYGYADYVSGAEVIDLKTTNNYTPHKYRDHWQHLVYPYCLVKGGLTEEFQQFTYLVAELSAGRDGVLRGDIYTETYNPTLEECETTIRQFLDCQFIPFLEDNRHLITDKKIFQ